MPRLPRFFISPDQISGAIIRVADEDVRHIVNVLRMKTGDELLLCDGEGTEYRTRIAVLNKTEVKTEIVAQTKNELRHPRITLGQGLPKSDKMDFIVQKATELGVAAVVPLMTERTIMKVKDEEKRLARWRKIAREAAMQSNRSDIPLIGPVVSFRDFIAAKAPGSRTLSLLPWEEGTELIKNVLRQNSGVGDIMVLIGPEGGFSIAEADAAKTHGFHAVSLGPTILRTETAAVAALSMIGYEFF
ncbi:MAG TPA: 16S rRNA (uracil(1498)-N(3))-methyltransferase [Nitrospirota bacterium]|nr:16S rRNA (uracil(1498)-N(3))-methyltransferase [Nitrospirota bacterium]